MGKKYYPRIITYNSFSTSLLIILTSIIIIIDSEVIKLLSCLIQLSMKIFLLINLKLLTTANSFFLKIAEYENFSANKHENANYCWNLHIY